MLKNSLFVTSVFAAVTIATSASAHPGHIVEVAGHGHLIAIGATLAAGALAALVGLAARKKAKEEIQNDEGEGVESENDTPEPA